jgi:hypothetical protein
MIDINGVKLNVGDYVWYRYEYKYFAPDIGKITEIRKDNKVLISFLLSRYQYIVKSKKLEYMPPEEALIHVLSI